MTARRFEYACADVEVTVAVDAGLAPDDPTPVICPADAAAFGRWLSARSAHEAACWLVYWKKGSGRENLRWSQAVDEALATDPSSR